MSDIELKATDLHWLPKGDPQDDCCIHGGIFLRIGEHIISAGDTEWTVSTAAFNLLKTVSHDHHVGDSEALIPCCGFNMWQDDSAPDGLLIPNCNNGIDWEIEHQGPVVIHKLLNGEQCTTQLLDWTRCVCNFADEVHEFFHTAWPKNIPSEEDKKGFELFLNLWDHRRRAAHNIIDAG